MTRRRRQGPPRCNTCGQRIRFLVWVTGHAYRPFEPEPVDGRNFAGGQAYPTEGVRSYRYEDLVDELRIRRHCSHADAEEEAYAMPWHVVHHCPLATPPASTVTTTREEG